MISTRSALGSCCPEMDVKQNTCSGCGKKYVLLTLPQHENVIDQIAQTLNHFASYIIDLHADLTDLDLRMSVLEDKIKDHEQQLIIARL